MYIQLKDLKKQYLGVHFSLHFHSNSIYKVQQIEETETNKIEYIAEGVLWPKKTIERLFSYEEVFTLYPEFLL